MELAHLARQEWLAGMLHPVGALFRGNHPFAGIVRNSDLERKDLTVQKNERPPITVASRGTLHSGLSPELDVPVSPSEDAPNIARLARVKR